MDITRRELVKKGSLFFLAATLGCSKSINTIVDNGIKEYEIFPAPHVPPSIYFSGQKPVVSIVKINEKWSDAKGIEYAVTKALDLIGGLEHITRGKERILLKPNLVYPSPSDTTKPQVIETLALLMKKAGKNICIGEASCASARNFRIFVVGNVCSAKDHKTLQEIQNDVFSKLGYIDVSQKTDVPLVNLHVGKMAKLAMKDNFVFKNIYIHEALYHTDMVCSVPMMKTHTLAGVSLALKNVGFGAYPGLIYGSVRSSVHRKATELEPTGTASAIIDMVKANKIGLNVIDGSCAMEGNGPSTAQGGKVFKMNLIFAGTNALATDMVAADVMGFATDEIDTFKWAHKAGMTPAKMDDIQIVGEKPANVRRPFEKPWIIPYRMIKNWYGPPC
jgi:uncharacterized protein (DUF362 family)